MYNYKEQHTINYDEEFYTLNYQTFGIEVKLKKDFLVVRETLERIGVINRKEKVITPSCYIICEMDKGLEDKYFICHFKELLARDGYRNRTDEIDYVRRNEIVTRLQSWGHIEIVDKDYVSNIDKLKIAVLPYKQKNMYKINHKYEINM